MKENGVIFDFDLTLVNTSKAMIQLLGEITKDKRIGNLPDYSLTWNYTDVFPNCDKEIIHKAFDSKELFNKLEILPNVQNVMELLHRNNIPMTIVSVGTPENIKLKMDFIQEKFHYCNFIPLIKYPNQEFMLDKTIAFGKVMFDDHATCLETSRTELKVCFKLNGLDYEWSRDWNGETITDWYQGEKLLKALYNIK